MKPIDVGFTTAYNEAECIRGWIRTAEYFCERVVVLVDPNNSDEMVNIIRAEFPAVEVQWQDRSLGNGDRYNPGTMHIWHANQNAFIDSIPMGQWFMFLDADERIPTGTFEDMAWEIERAKEAGMSCVVHENKYEFYGSTREVVDWGPMCFLQPIFRKKDRPIVRGTAPHSSFPIWLFQRTDIPIYHYSRVKDTQDAFKWTDLDVNSTYVQMFGVDRGGVVRTAKMDNPIPDWRNMDDVARLHHCDD